MDINKKKDILINVLFYSLILLVILLLYKYIVPVLIPFFVGYLIAYATVKLTARIKIRNPFIRILFAVIIYGTIGTLVVFGSLKLITYLYNFFLNIPMLYETKVMPYTSVLVNYVTETIEQLDPSIVYTIEAIFENMGSIFKNLIATVSGKAVDFFSGLISGVPSVVVKVLLTVISSLFFIADYDRIQTFLKDNVPTSVQQRFINIKIYIKDTVFVVLRSYMLIMIITFTELSILFLIFGINNALLIAGIIAILDIMPILGTGGVLIPWALISFISNDFVLGVKLLAIYAIVMVVRNYIEPKIVGAQLGLHPIITLITMFIGLQLFGFIGMFGIPVIVSYLWKRYKIEQLNEKEKAAV